MSHEDVSVVFAHGAWTDGPSWARVITAACRGDQRGCQADQFLNSQNQTTHHDRKE